MGTNFKEQNTKTEVETTTIGWETKCLSLPYVSAHTSKLKRVFALFFIPPSPEPERPSNLGAIKEPVWLR